MSSPFPDRRPPGGRPRVAGLLAPAALAALAMAACEREERRVREVPPGASPSAVIVDEHLQPGPVIVDPVVRSAYEENAWAIAEGQTYYVAFNCAGCHAPGGGGGMGPPLIDSIWIYGSDPENLYATIVEGRPRGMPAFGARLGNPEIWKLVAYVRYLGGFTPQDTRPGRLDHMSGLAVDPQEGPPSAARGEIPPEQRPPGESVPPPPAAPDSLEGR